MKHFPHLIGQIFNRPMLATPELMFEAVSFARLHLGLFVAEMDGIAMAPRGGRIENNEGDALDDSTGADGAADGTGVAQIGIYGPLVARTGNLRMCQTMTAYESIDKELDEALADPAIRRIVLDIDSNGGDAVGAFETADRIRAVNLVKPVHAIIHFRAFSGGYLLAAAAGEISVSQSSGIGSIGVIAKHIDVSKMNEDLGVKVTSLYRGARKNDLSSDEPLSEGARQWLDGMLDRTYGQFTGYVAKFRNMPIPSVIATDAGLYFGQDALAAGLADRLETPQAAFDRVVQAAAADRAGPKVQTSAPAFAANTQSQRLRLAAAAMAMNQMQ